MLLRCGIMWGLKFQAVPSSFRLGVALFNSPKHILIYSITLIRKGNSSIVLIYLLLKLFLPKGVVYERHNLLNRKYLY